MRPHSRSSSWVLALLAFSCHSASAAWGGGTKAGRRLILTAIKGHVHSQELDGARSVAVRGKYAYVAAACPVAHPQHISSRTGARPRHVCCLPLPRPVLHLLGPYQTTPAQSVADALTVVDISDIAKPRVVGHVSSEKLNGANFVELANDGKTAWVAATFSDAVVAVDIQDPKAPRVVGHVTDSNMLDGTWWLTVHGEHVIATSSLKNTVVAINAADPTKPRVVSKLTDASKLRDVQGIAINNGAWASARPLSPAPVCRW